MYQPSETIAEREKKRAAEAAESDTDTEMDSDDEEGDEDENDENDEDDDDEGDEEDDGEDEEEDEEGCTELDYFTKKHEDVEYDALLDNAFEILDEDLYIFQDDLDHEMEKLEKMLRQSKKMEVKEIKFCRSMSIFFFFLKGRV